MLFAQGKDGTGQRQKQRSIIEFVGKSLGPSGAGEDFVLG